MPSACMAFIIRNAAGRVLIVAVCGIGGAPSAGLINSAGVPPPLPDTNSRTSPRGDRLLTPPAAGIILRSWQSAALAEGFGRRRGRWAAVTVDGQAQTARP